MNGPRILCAGCASPTSVGKPVCDDCIEVLQEHADGYCALCQAAQTKGAEIMPADKQGDHLTQRGGYAGRCYLAT
jgi:predicted amidophosphoribosyltransferase